MRKSSIANGISFILGVFALISVRLVGLITISELLSCIFLPFLLFACPDNDAFKANRTKTSFVFFLWVLGVVLSDVYNHSTFENFLRGIGHPFCIFILFLTFQKLLQLSPKSLSWFFYGVVISTVLFYLTDTSAQENFRFGLYVTICYLVGCVANNLWDAKFKLSAIMLISLLAVIGLATGSRSNFLIIGGATVLLYLIWQQKLFVYHSYRYIYKLMLVFTIVMVVFQYLYVLAVKSHLFPQEYQAKYENQLKSGLPIIFSGRSEIYSSVQALYDSPIFGHGSWAVKPIYNEIYIRAQSAGNSDDISEGDQEALRSGKIPTHSFIFGGWVENGLLAMFFFVFFGKRLLNLMLYYINNGARYEVPFMMIIIVTNVWHLFFSPLDSGKRIFVSLILAINALYILDKHKRKATLAHTPELVTSS